MRPFSTDTRVALSQRAKSPSCPVAVQRSNLVLLQVSCLLTSWAVLWLVVILTLISTREPHAKAQSEIMGPLLVLRCLCYHLCALYVTLSSI